jgi:putative ABC transport system permease protein
LARYGRLSDGQRLQAMASFGDTSAPVQLKAVDALWPLVGRLELADGRRVGAPAAGTAWIARGAAERLGVKVGETFTIASKPLRVGGIIAVEPDGLGEGFALGPTVIVPMGFPDSAGLTAPGAMYRSRLRMDCGGACDAAAIADDLAKRFPENGLDIRTRDKASPGTETFIARMGDFLVLVGLAALLIAGIGIGGGTASYLEARRGVIATLKVMGATSADIARIYVLQITAAAGLALWPGWWRGWRCCLWWSRRWRVFARGRWLCAGAMALARAALWGLLVALVFAAGPLLAARTYPAMALLRARVAPVAPKGSWRWVAAGLAGIVGLAFLGDGSPRRPRFSWAGRRRLLFCFRFWAGVCRAWRRGCRAPKARSCVWRLAICTAPAIRPRGW